MTEQSQISYGEDASIYNRMISCGMDSLYSAIVDLNSDAKEGVLPEEDAAVKEIVQAIGEIVNIINVPHIIF